MLTLVWLFGAGPLGAFMGRLTEVQTNDDSSFLPVSAESTEVSRIQEDFEQQDRVPAIIAYSAEDTLTQEQLAAIGEHVATIQDHPEISDGEAIGPVPGTEDDSVAQVVVPLREGADVGDTVEELRALLAEDPVDGVEVYVAGPAGLVADLSAAFGGIDSTLLLVALGAVLIILVTVYRSPILPVVVILTSMLALVLAAALVYAAAAAEWIQLNGQSQGILFILVVGACTDYALLLVSRYRETLQEHARPLEAMRTAVRGTVEPVLASGGTVILGVLCLLASDLASNRGLGPVAAIGIATALVAALTFLPAVLLLLGRAAFWPVRPRFEGVEASGEAETTETMLRRHRLWGAIATAVSRHPRRYWVATTVLLLAAAAFVPQFRAEGTSDFDIFRTEVDSVTGQEILEDGFGHAVTAQPAVIVADADRIDEVVAAAEEVEGVTEVVPVTEEPETPAGAPPADGGEDAPAGPPPGVTGGEDSEPQGPPPGVAGGEDSEAQGPPPGVTGGEPVEAEPKVVDGRVLLEASLSEPAASTEAVEITRDLREAVHAVDGADALVGGPSAESLDTLDTATRDLYVVVPLVLAVVLLVLVVLLRSLVAPVLLIITTVVSFGSALGVGAIVFNHLLDLPGADPGVPLFAFVFLVALGIDYNIFLMTRVREEAKGFGHREGVLRGLTVTGGVITSAGVVLAATFAALVVVPLLFLLQLAFLVAFGVLLDALIVRSLLVPALSLDVGRAMWWPSRLARDKA
ncbi:membrane protein [Thermobifida cellulosilytica TB100]|uniref:Membrane protein n=2 Tax=Thermobifida cellulosilytica TaxID=144786 RepID=A0A147KER8_THECS|nr:membrane protein [Thermobifida cellulosilytica TB100]